VKRARNAATKRISRLELQLQLHHSGFAPTHVSATSIEVHGPVSNQTALVRVHGGAILDPGDVVVDG